MVDVGPVASKSPTRVHVTVTGDLFDRLADFHRAAGIPGTVSDTARELLRAALDAPQVSSAIVIETRRRAYRQVRGEMIKRFRQALWQTLIEFDRSLGTFNDEELDLHFDSEIAER